MTSSCLCRPMSSRVTPASWTITERRSVGATDDASPRWVDHCQCASPSASRSPRSFLRGFPSASLSYRVKPRDLLPVRMARRLLVASNSAECAGLAMTVSTAIS
jgi:hypothetical protein